ncbi:NAD(P)-dependent oxidoreductase [Natronoflexus pectinivorans]|uniref:Lactate dehydrogenase-like 2-hydroxyacid dehydrogenase n=1 Tax=Natronoflexus pectinivorans TaxID=682526 RepID=A0A4R2GKF0_9BACT|nr:NAD(P)-dependent oxidoreductase [Natronoflexus pectinivorans]TCO09331.1 lactate dehydrogenase-like 2-hydroxyacid dehydrogenase [Natronoflexus pectinivorans]
MFRKLVAIEPVGIVPHVENKLKQFAKEVIMYPDIPMDSNEIALRINDADAVLLSYTTTLDAETLKKCPNVQYIGMCCLLYSPESANVDIRYAEKNGITVTGIRDYGDEGVVEYVISELVRCLHGFGANDNGTDTKPWFGMPSEITGLKTGIIGLGKVGGMTADALKFFGAEISYFSRSEKEEANAKGFRYMDLNNLLSYNDVIICCLNKNTVLLHNEQFNHLGNRKILFNVGLSPAWDREAFEKWIKEDNICFCDSFEALGSIELANHPNVKCMGVSSGRTKQAFERLSEKVLKNIEEFIQNRKYHQ